MHWLEVLKDYIHLGLGGVASMWIYKEKVNEMTFHEKFIYVTLSIAIGFYGGNGICEHFGIDLASSRAHLISILMTIFGLAILGQLRENLTSIFEMIKTKWLS